MTHFWTRFSFVSSRKWGAHHQLLDGPLLRRIQIGTRVGWRGLGLGKGWGEGGWAGWGVPLVHYTPDSSLITPAETLRPSQCSSPSLSFTYKTLSLRWWQLTPTSPHLAKINSTHNAYPLLKTTISVIWHLRKVFVSTFRFYPPLSPPIFCTLLSPTTTFFSLLLIFSLSLCDKWVLIKTDRAMKLKECIPWPAIALAWVWHWHI